MLLNIHEVDSVFGPPGCRPKRAAGAAPRVALAWHLSERPDPAGMLC